MSQITTFTIGGGGGSNVLTLTGNSGGAVSPSAGNINVIGDGTTIDVVGDPGTNTLTISAIGGGSGIVTIDGNSGSVTGSTVSIGQGTGSLNFVGSGTAMVFDIVDSSHNMILNSARASFTVTTQNTGVGYQVFQNLGFRATGPDALNSTGNCAFGYQAMMLADSGDNEATNYSVAIGYQAGLQWNLGGESSNIVINSPGVQGETNTLHIGAGTGTGNQQLTAAFISGINGISVSGVPVIVSSGDQLGITVSSERYKENIEDMDIYSEDIMDFRCVTFNYKKDLSETVSVGLIAEEVYEIMPQLIIKDNEGLPMTVKYLDLIPMMLNEIQKLKKEIDELRELVEEGE